jgi:hypothetical protein
MNPSLSSIAVAKRRQTPTSCINFQVPTRINLQGPATPADVKRLKALESENAKLKRLLAERDLEIDIMREVNRKKW